MRKLESVFKKHPMENHFDSPIRCILSMTNFSAFYGLLCQIRVNLTVLHSCMQRETCSKVKLPSGTIYP